jgi:serine/threonine-protein kinase
MNRIVNGDIPPPSGLRASYPKELERIVMRALSRDRDRRYTTAHELRLDLELFARERKLRASPPALAEYMHAMFSPQPFPWGALQPGPGGSQPATAVTVSDLGSGPGSSASISSSARPDTTPVSNASLAGRSRVTITKIDNTRALKGLAVGLGVLALAAVVTVAVLVANKDEAAAAPVGASDPADAPLTAVPPAQPEPAQAKPAVPSSAPAEDAPIDPSGPVAEPEPEIVDEEPAAPKPKKKSAGKKTNKGAKSGKPDLDAFLPQ